MYNRPRPLPFPPSQTITSFRSRQIVTHQNQLNEKVILELLDVLQRKLLERRGEQTTLVVHGGFLSVLAHKHRAVTTDIDYIERVLPEELNLPIKKPVPAPGVLLKKFLRSLTCRTVRDTKNIIKECVAETAAEFNSRHSNPLIVLEHDWMNSAADVALPWYLNSECHMVDPLVISAVRNAEAEGDTVYDSPGLRLLGITSAWTFALKLQRYSELDEDDIVYLLQEDGACARFSEDDFVRMVEHRLRTDCPAMEYEHFPERAMMEWRARLRGCVRKAKYRMSVQRNMSD